jgi:molybdenum cofactor cytidylyltransferase
LGAPAAAGLILAAGAGSRFGEQPKLMAVLDGRPLLEHVIAAMTEVGELERVIVVLGAHAEQLLAGVDFGRSEPLVCPNWSQGLSASLRCGVLALGARERVLVALGDTPGLTAQVVRRVLAAAPGTRARYGGVPGHPVLLGPDQLGRLGELRGDSGARELLAGGETIECQDLASGQDVDTHADLDGLRFRSGSG